MKHGVVKRFWKTTDHAINDGLTENRKMDMLHLTAPIAFQAAADDGDKRRPTFSMLAYTGEKVRLAGLPLATVIDLATTSAPRQSVPVFQNYDPDRIVGHTNEIQIDASGIRAKGVFSSDGEDAKRAVDLGGAGFPWNASASVGDGAREYVPDGKTTTVNGRSVRGPVYVYQNGTVRGLSLVTLNDDGNTSMSIAAQHEDGMFAAYLKQSGIDPITCPVGGLTSLRTAWDRRPAPEQPPTSAPAADFVKSLVADFAKATAATIKQEAARCCEIVRMSATVRAAGIDNQIAAELFSEALQSGWTPAKYAEAITAQFGGSWGNRNGA
jgi:hypothetical protein